MQPDPSRQPAPPVTTASPGPLPTTRITTPRTSEGRRVLATRTTNVDKEPSAADGSKVSFWRKAAGVIVTFGAAEVAGTLSAMAGVACAATFVGSGTGLASSSAFVGIAGTLAENVGFYGVLMFQEFRQASNKLAETGQTLNGPAIRSVLRQAFHKYGWAELVDSLCTRPLLMSLGGAGGGFVGDAVAEQGQAFGVGSGAVLFKFIADALYYSLVAFFMHRASQRSS